MICLSFLVELTYLLNSFIVGGPKDSYKKPNLEFIKVSQLNTLNHYDGGENLGPQRYPKFAHILLIPLFPLGIIQPNGLNLS